MKGVLKVLMWKHLIVRMRRFIHTPVEIIAPILLFILYYLFKDQIASIPPVNTYNDSIQQTESVEINSVSNPVEIYYTPETDFTNRLMKLVENYYVLHPPPNTFVANAKPSIKPLQNTSMLQKPPHGVAVVIFKGLDLSDEKPPKLTYTIRMYEDFKTYSYISEDVYIGPHYGFGTVYETFMKLQWAVDSGYLKILGDRDIPENVVLKEFPYKKSHQDYTATLVAEMMATICSLSLLLVFVFLMARLLEERVTGIQELIKMVGVSNTMLSISHVLNCAPTCLVFAVVPAILLTISSTPVLQNTNIILIMILLALYFISIMSMAFVCSYIVNNDQYTVTIAVFSYIFLSIPTRVVLGVGAPRWLLPLCGLLPHMPMEWFWKESGALQQFGLGLNFGNMASTHTASTMSALSCYLYLIAQSIIFFALSWYLSYVRPGPYGQPLPWNFICNEAYWGKTKVTPQESEELEELEEAEEINPEYFDQPIKDAEVGIKVVNVTKVFGKNRALHNVSLDVYKGEITVLLGHNGAGKTTLMSIITGMLKPTEGKVYVEGFDTDTQKDEMRKHLGLCPQHNLFFKDLTILEHVIFFTMIKGIPYGKAKESSTKLLEQLNLGDKLQERSSSLSGGMKRRLQLACALAGDARVLVLDEPTSGLDVETRRELWDLLLSLSASRTVLLSTHFMEEAEALGERVAALRAGRLRCRASTMRLKRAIGSGYRLSFTTIGLPNEPALTAAILSVIPEASLKETSLNSISYNLPAKNTDKFPKLFNLLESKRSELGINTIGVGVSTLEEVFLKLCSDITTTFTDDAVDGETEEVEQEIVTGFHLCTQQLLVLLKRQLKYLWSKKISFIIMQVILPILLIIVFTLITNNRFYDVPEGDGKQTLAMDLNMYEPMTDRRALYSVNSDKYNIDNVKKRNPKVAFENTDDVAKAVLRVGTKDTMEYNKYLVGVELNDTDAKILFTTVVRHAAPVALNLLSNLLASRNGHSITTYNDPAYENTYRETRKNEPKHMGLLGLWSFMLVFTILATVANSASLPCKERESGARHLHVMAGCAPALHWLATLLAHAALHTLALVLPALAVAAALEQDGTIDQGDFLAVLAFVMILGIMAFLSLIYLVSFIFGERGAGVMLVGIIVIFGFIFPLLSQMPRNDGTKTLYYFLDTSSYLMPPHAFSMAVLNLAGIARDNVTPDTPRRSSWAIDDYSPGLYVLLLFVQFVVLMTLVILTEYGVFNSCCDRFFNVRYVPSTPANVDRMVAAEKLYVDKAIALPPKQIQDAMLANDLHKNYPSLLRKSCNAVRGVSFSVKPGECFGLLGVNGAGKSTTFKMLTAVECPTRGSIFSNGHFMKMLSGEYLRSLGYCPQTQALDEFLSGRDNIVLLLTLRGVAPHQLKEQTDKWINIVGLERYATRALSTYSGGCARRLSAAAALCAGTCTLLDEPTAGVDVAARRRLWAAVRRAARVRALVVCSHSMDEMEALCGRIAIMSRGRIRALGEAAELRAAHGAGHALTLKLYHRPRAAPAADVDETDSAMTDLNHLKATLREKFNCTLRDEHSTTLHYHINDTMVYSDLFAALERLKEKFPNLLEDYSVTETTLEEVFLSFAKEEVNEGPTPV